MNEMQNQGRATKVLRDIREEYAAAMTRSLFAQLVLASAGRIFSAMKLPLYLQDGGSD